MAYNILPISANQLHVIQSQLLWVNEYLHLQWPDNSKDPTWLATQVSQNIAVRVSEGTPCVSFIAYRFP